MKKNQCGFGVIGMVIAVLILAAISFGGWVIFRHNKANDPVRQQSPQISNFEECAAAGNPIMESYPEQCSANGQTFVKGH